MYLKISSFRELFAKLTCVNELQDVTKRDLHRSGPPDGERRLPLRGRRVSEGEVRRKKENQEALTSSALLAKLTL
jgi:hypothetical protein